MKRMLTITTVLTIASINIAFAQLTIDRTRVIFDRDQSNSQSIVVSNTNKNEPYLAQSWIEDEIGNKIESPLIALPILQRINPGQEKQVKISLAGQNNLPIDRESMLFFNVLGVPPKTGEENQVNIVIQSKIKLFYRPKGLQQYKDNGWLKELKISKIRNNYTLQNPTAYHMIIFGFSNGPKGKIIEQDITLKPFEDKMINLPITNPTVYFINDFGGTTSQDYQCNTNGCSLL